MNPSPARLAGKWRALAELPALAGAAYVVVLLAVTVAGRLGHPYDLEWMEGGMLLHALRVMEGKPLYVVPSGDFIPFIYPPLYHWLLGGLGSLLGAVDYLPGRVLSLVGTMAGVWALVVALRKEGGSWPLSVAVGGLFLSTFDETGAFFDLVRIDGLLLALWAWALVAIRWGWLRVGGLLLVAAFATKHHAAAFGLPALIWLWRTEGRSAALRFAAWSVGPALAFTLGMLLEGDGMFLTYLLGVPAGHGVVAERLFLTAPKELALGLPVLTGGILAGLVVSWRRSGAGNLYWAAQCLLALALACLMRGHVGGFKNVLIPGYWAVALAGGLGIVALRTRFPRPAVLAGVSLLLGAQGWLGRWEPERYRPRPQDEAAGDRVVAKLAGVEGDVLAPWHPWLAVKAGKAPAFHLIALWDIDHDWGPLHGEVDAIRAEIASHRWGGIMTANDRPAYGIREHYERGPMVRPAGQALKPRTGWAVQPHRIWVPRSPAQATSGGGEAGAASDASGQRE